MTDNQAKIVAAMDMLPDEMESDEFEALLCALVNTVVSDEEIPDFFEYMATKVRMIQKVLMMQADQETKH